jgi:hypothetical protein
MQVEIYKRKDSETIFDIALKVTGDVSEAINIAFVNGLDIDADLPATLNCEYQDNYMVDYLADIEFTTGSTLIDKPETTLTYVNTGAGDNYIMPKPEIKSFYFVKAEQTIFDIALQISENVEDAISILVENNLTFDSILTVGSVIKFSGELLIPEDITTAGEMIRGVTKIGAFSNGFSVGFN